MHLGQLLPTPPLLESPTLINSATGSAQFAVPGSKDASKGSDQLRRSLLARAKDLEDQIARSKLELAGRTQSSTSLSDQVPHNEAEAEASAAQSTQTDSRATLQLPNPQHIKTPQSQAEVSPSVPVDIASSTTESASVRPETAHEPEVLEAMAVDFITEVVQSIHGKPSSALKLELAARQKMLEEHIAETKLLISKLNSAKSKKDKEALIAILRIKSRCVPAPRQAKGF